MTAQISYASVGERLDGRYYRHSGRTPLGSLVVAGVAGLVAGIAGGIVYAYTIEYIPFVKLRALAAMLFGGAVGLIGARVAKRGKVRSPALGLAVVGATTLVALYVCWVVWIKITLDRLFGGQGNYR